MSASSVMPVAYVDASVEFEEVSDIVVGSERSTF